MGRAHPLHSRVAPTRIPLGPSQKRRARCGSRTTSAAGGSCPSRRERPRGRHRPGDTHARPQPRTLVVGGPRDRCLDEPPGLQTFPQDALGRDHGYAGPACRPRPTPPIAMTPCVGTAGQRSRPRSARRVAAAGSRRPSRRAGGGVVHEGVACARARASPSTRIPITTTVRRSGSRPRCTGRPRLPRHARATASPIASTPPSPIPCTRRHRPSIRSPVGSAPTHLHRHPSRSLPPGATQPRTCRSKHVPPSADAVAPRRSWRASTRAHDSQNAPGHRVAIPDACAANRRAAPPQPGPRSSIGAPRGQTADRAMHRGATPTHPPLHDSGSPVSGQHAH